MNNKLALVLSGGFVKGAAHISIAEEMYKRGYVPDVFVGTSIGAVFAVLLGLYDDPEKVKEISLKFTKKHILPRLLSFDPFSRAGLLQSKATVDLIAEEAGFAGKTFKDLKKPVYITATDLNTGKLIVFGIGRQSTVVSRQRTVDRLQTTGDCSLTEALEASISFPVIFKPKKMKAGSKVLALADGGIRENCPILVAARVPGVKRIIACDLGYCGQLKGDFNKKRMIDVFMQCLELTTSFSQINRYINDDLFADNRISVRIINPGIFDVGPFAFGKIPDVMQKASRTARRVFGAFKKPEQFFKPWRSDPIKRRGIKVERIGERELALSAAKGTNAVQVVDFGL